MHPAFNFRLNSTVAVGRVTLGKFDGKSSSLAFAGGNDTVTIHSPNQKLQAADEKQTLTINRHVTSLTSGALDHGGDEKEVHDLLLVGTETNLLAYDAVDNTDVFYKDIPNGVHACVTGPISTLNQPLAIVGGNGAIQGFDNTGKETYWSVASDNIVSMCVKKNGRAEPQLIVGSEDKEIRILEHENLVGTITESDVPLHLVDMGAPHQWGVALENGGLAMYDKTTRLWSAKQNQEPTSLAAFDLNGDGVDEMVVGWADGDVEVRDTTNGNLICKDTMSSVVAGTLVDDYRMVGKSELVCVSTSGEVKGYSQAAMDNELSSMVDMASSNRTLEELLAVKQELSLQMANYEASIKEVKSGVKRSSSALFTKVKAAISPDPDAMQVCLTLQSHSDAVMKVVILRSDVLFADETFMVHPAKPSQQLSIPLKITKNVQAEIEIQVILGLRSSKQDHVVQLQKTVPRFAAFMYKPIVKGQLPTGKLSFITNDRPNRVALWLQRTCTITAEEIHESTRSSDSLNVLLLNVLDGSTLLIRMANQTKGMVEIATDSMDVAADVFQDLCAYLKIDEIQSQASFPAEMEAFQEVLQRVDDHNALRMKMSADIADVTNLVKALVIKAEDARIMNDMELMKQHYTRLYQLNQELIGEYLKRANNHAGLLAALKKVNQMIQKASRLRMGRFQKQLVTQCRKAIKANQVRELFKIIEVGHAS